jgi:hypothetical protein
MSLRIAEFPQDVLLELAKRLDVADLLCFLSVCYEQWKAQRWLIFPSSAASSADASS